MPILRNCRIGILILSFKHALVTCVKIVKYGKS